MENMKPDSKRKVLIILAFISLLVDAAVSIPLNRGEYASANAAAVRSTLAVGSLPLGEARFSSFISKFSRFNKFFKDYPKLMNKQVLSKVELSPRQRVAYGDCMLMGVDMASQLYASRDILKEFINKNYTRKRDIYQLLTGVQTNFLTCLDGFSHSRTDKKVQAEFKARLTMPFNAASNWISAIDGLSKTTVTVTVKRRTSEEWPEWLSAGDRKLLQEPAVKANVTVAADGTGDYRTVSEAVAVAPAKSSERYVIRIKAGVYMENVVIPKEKTNLMFVGDGQLKTFIKASKNGDDNTPFNSATVAVAGDRFLARDITFTNSAGPSKLHAVALRVNADFSVFYKCGIFGHQNTLYVHSLRQFYTHCHIAGTVDFIFGNAAVVFWNCRIIVLPPNSKQYNTITAQGRSHPSQETGIVIQNCSITATRGADGKSTTYLGRPWQKYSRTVVMQTQISNVIHPAGWSEWNGKFALDTLYYAEYKNTGPGAETGSRVNWKGFRVLKSPLEAQELLSYIVFS